ncbi:uncharacterized protein F4822DRAFT_405603 [Hypoxylon trugodes]|uniref:uncharacterized protein n=1 Tax=Hypoxylon trugodes TaxID=326681 RepID=UPI002190477A|nr:uncharacterized protein F4822DRAFT_405603 [Hypoxylon trugodes]KAI1387151.1 hypothetical protein F4822DRAFT_405603 [Hypoxylon trugodes]
MAELTRVDSAVQGLEISSPTKDAPPISPVKEKASHRRASSSATGILSMKDLKENKTEIQVAKESQGTGWKINTSPTSIEDKEILTKPLITPLVRAVNLHFPHGVVVTARNNKTGVTIKDAMDAIHKPYKKRADDELDKPYLKGFEWAANHPQLKDDPEKAKEREAEWDRLYIHLSSTPDVAHFGGGGKKKKKHNADAE